MIYGVFSILDDKTGFLSPALDEHNESALRNFHHAAMNVDSLFYTHPSDYSLYRIGDFDTQSGLITACIPPVLIVRASQFVKGE